MRLVAAHAGQMQDESTCQEGEQSPGVHCARIGLGWSIDRASDAALVLMHRTYRAVDAEEATWRAGKLRVAESQSGHGQGGTRVFGLRVCTRIKILPQWGQRGASDGSLTTGIIGV
jgi:hypothetical protein